MKYRLECTDVGGKRALLILRVYGIVRHEVSVHSAAVFLAGSTVGGLRSAAVPIHVPV